MASRTQSLKIETHERKSEIRKAAPKLGQHSIEILQALGYDQNKLDDLLKAKVILQEP